MQKTIPTKTSFPEITVAGDGMTIAYYWQYSESLEVFDLMDSRNSDKSLSQIIWTEYARWLSKFVLSPDGRYLVTAHYGSNYWENHPAESDNYTERIIIVWDVATGTVKYQDEFSLFYGSPLRSMNSSSELLDLKFISQDRFVVVGKSGELGIWSTKSSKRLWAVSASSLSADAIAFDNAMETFAIVEQNPSGGFGSRVNFIGQHYVLGGASVFYGYFGQVQVEEFLFRGAKLRRWNLNDGRLVQDELEYNLTDTLIFSPDNTLLAAGYTKYTTLVDVESGLSISELPKPSYLIGFTDDGQNLVVQKEDNQVNVWNIQQERFYKNFAFPGKIHYTQMVSDNRVVVVINDGKDSIVRVVDLGEMIVS